MRKVFLLLILFPLLVRANVIISTTRAIYPAGKKEVSIQLLNNGTDPSLVQSWIDDGDPNSTPETSKVPFLLIPPVVKISGQNGQQIRIKYLGDTLPLDRESLFYLNVLDIPPIPPNMQDKNIMQLAIKSRIKMFYRPKNLASKPDDIGQKVTIMPHGTTITIKNTSPYFVTLSALNQAPAGINLLKEAIMIAPFSENTLHTEKSLNRGSTVKVTYINDYGVQVPFQTNTQ